MALQVALLALVAVVAAAAAAWAAPLEAFFGTYQGAGRVGGAEGLAERDLDVEIGPVDGGFNVTWKTSYAYADPDRVKRKVHSIDFEPTAREGIYASRMRMNKFGDRVPLDPLQGHPFVWARIHGDTLSVYALMITDSGTYEMQVYDRALTERGLALTFSRFREGEMVRRIEADLLRVGP
jgi:hypothetical protein